MATRTFDSIDITGKHEPLTVPSNGTIQDLINEARRKHKVPPGVEFRLIVQGQRFKSDDISVTSRKFSDWGAFSSSDPKIYIEIILRAGPQQEMRNSSIQAKSGVLRECRAKYAARGGKSRKHRKSRRKTRRNSRR